MSRQLFEIDITITLEAPYLVHGNDAGRFGLDATLLKDHRGRPALPGTLIAGRIAEAFFSLGNQFGNANDMVDSWFGKLGVGAEGRRARLMVEDLVLTTIDGNEWTVSNQTADITRIRQNDDTGAVETGALLVIEQIAKPGAHLNFKGTWRTWATQIETDILLPQLRAALMLQTQLGAYRGVGFGRLKGVQVIGRFATTGEFRLPVEKNRYRLSLTCDQPLCVGSRSRRGNVFESDDHISGGTILGAIATMLGAQHGLASLAGLEGSALARHFSTLRCTHALPAPKGRARPLPLPQSLLSLNGAIKDAWRLETPPKGLDQAPAFQTDWKGSDNDKAKEKQGWGATIRSLRVRTDIDGNGQAKDRSLFAYECAVAALDDQGQSQTEWLFDLDLSEVPEADRDGVRFELAKLLAHGLQPVGKTDAHLSVTAAADGSVWDSKNLDSLKENDLVPVLLASDALLFITDEIADKPKVDLKQVYAKAFEDIASQVGHTQALELSHFFATQRLAGGEYLWKQFQKTDTYQPWVLTEAGSVFVFKVNDAVAARKLLAHWQDRGLNLPKTVNPEGAPDWQTQPYRRANGYGEVAIWPKHGFADL